MDTRRENLKQKFKQKREGFGDLGIGRIARAEDLQNKRKQGRANVFAKTRAFPNTNEKTNTVLSSSNAKVKKPEENKKNPLDTRPPFRVGIVHYPLYPANSIPTVSLHKSQKVTSSKVTQKDTKVEAAQSMNPNVVKKPKFEINSKQNVNSKPVVQVAAKKISKVTEKKLAAKALEASKSSAPHVIKRRRLDASEKNQTNNEKAKLNTTFEKDTPTISTKIEDNETGILKRKSRINDKTQTKLNETFEKDLDEAGKANLSKSIISSTALIDNNAGNINLSASASFLLRNEQVSTPNNSIEDITLYCSEDSKKFKSVLSDQESTTEKSRKISSRNTSKDSISSNDEKRVNENSTFEIKKTSKMSRSRSLEKSSLNDEISNKNNSNVTRQSAVQTKESSIKKDKSNKRNEPEISIEKDEINETSTSQLKIKKSKIRTSNSKKSFDKSGDLNGSNSVSKNVAGHNDTFEIEEPTTSHVKEFKNNNSNASKTGIVEHEIISNNTPSMNANSSFENKRKKSKVSKSKSWTIEDENVSNCDTKLALDDAINVSDLKDKDSTKDVKERTHIIKRRKSSIRNSSQENLIDKEANESIPINNHSENDRTRNSALKAVKNRPSEMKKSPKLQKSLNESENASVEKSTEVIKNIKSVHLKENVSDEIKKVSPKIEINCNQINPLLDSKVVIVKDPLSRDLKEKTYETQKKLFIQNDLIGRRSSTPLCKSVSLEKLQKTPKVHLQKLPDSVSLKNSSFQFQNKDETTPLKTPLLKVESCKEMFPALLSPHVVCSRGKKNARKEQEIRRSLGVYRPSSNEDNIPTKDTVMQNLNILVEEEEKTAQYFKYLVNKEIERLTELCDEWSKKMEDENVPEDGKNLINQAIGQTQLLLRKKIQRFLSLVKDCEEGQGQHLVTCKDLQGFWDMTYIEVENCNSRFNYLSKLEERNWLDVMEVSQPVKKSKNKIKIKSKNDGPVKKPEIKSRSGGIRDMIRAAKMKSKKLNQNDEINFVIVEKPKNHDETKIAFMDDSKKKIDVFTSKSPLINQRTSTPSSLVKSRKSLKKESPLTMMKVSRLYKVPMIELDQSISYVNSCQTPGKSILKKLDGNLDLNQSKKSTNKVNFNDTVIHNEFQIDEEEATKRSLAEALARIDSYRMSDDEEENEDDLSIRVERKLIFDTSDISKQTIVEDSEEDDKENVDDDKTEIEEKSINLKNNSKILNTTELEEDPIEQDEIVTRTLRNRSIRTPVKTPKLKLASKKEEQENVINNESTMKRSRMKSIGKANTSLSDSMNSSSTSRRIKIKKRSVAFQETLENNDEKSFKNSTPNIIRVKEEYIKHHPSQKKILPKGTPIRRTKKMDLNISEINSPKISTPR